MKAIGKLIKAAMVIFFALAGLGIVSSILVEHSQSPPKARRAVPPVTFSEVYSKMDNMTDAQWEEYQSTIRGARITGKGWVREVERKGSGYRVAVGTVPPLMSFLFSGAFLEGTPKKTALALNEADKVVYTGNLVSAHKILERLVVTVQPAKISKAAD